MNTIDFKVEGYLKRKNIENYVIENQKYMYRIAISYTKNEDDALEIVQNTIYKALSFSNSLKDTNLIKHWVTRILINNCFDHLKRNKKLILVDEIFEEIEGNDNILDKILLENAMNNLPPKLKIIIILRFFEDFKIKEISEILDMKENTVKTNLYKALKILKINLEEDFIDE